MATAAAAASTRIRFPATPQNLHKNGKESGLKTPRIQSIFGMHPNKSDPNPQDLKDPTEVCALMGMRGNYRILGSGETRYNKEGLLQGQAIDSNLSEIGQQQAEAAGRYLKDVRFSNVFASDMLRAQQTAETIMKHNSSCSALQMACDPLLKEISFGVAEGGRLQDVKDMAKAAGQSFPGFTPPDGETQEQVKERVKGFLEKMLQQIGSEHWPDGGEAETPVSAPPETSPVEGQPDDGVRGVPVHALVVTHGAYMCVAVRYFVEELHCSLPPGSDKAHMFSLSPNTGLCRFIITARKDDGGFRLSGIRCVFVHRGDHVKQ